MQRFLPFTLPLSPWSPLKNTNINNLALIIPILIVGLIYEDALLVFYIHSTISQLSYPLYQHHQKGRNTRRSPSCFLQRGSTAPHEVKNTKKIVQPRNMWQIFVRRFFALDKALKTTNNCIQPHKVQRKTNN